jgi:hypothetical protein
VPFIVAVNAAVVVTVGVAGMTVGELGSRVGVDAGGTVGAAGATTVVGVSVGIGACVGAGAGVLQPVAPSTKSAMAKEAVNSVKRLYDMGTLLVSFESWRLLATSCSSMIRAVSRRRFRVAWQKDYNPATLFVNWAKSHEGSFHPDSRPLPLAARTLCYPTPGPN